MGIRGANWDADKIRRSPTPNMNLLHNIPPEVYHAFFKDTEGAPLDACAGVSVVAEDPNWDTSRVPLLSELCVAVLARFFTRNPNVVGYLKGRDKALYLDLLSTGEPLTFTAERIGDEQYWQRCCMEKYRVRIRGRLCTLTFSLN